MIELPGPCPVFRRDPLAPGQHRWTFATPMSTQVRNTLTGQVITIPSVILTCQCGEVRHLRLPDIEDVGVIQ